MISAAVAIVPLGLLRARPLHRWFNALGLHPKLHRRAKVRVTRMPMEGREAPSPGWEYSFEKDGGDHRCLPDREGAVWEHRMVLGLGTPLGGGAHQRLGTEGSFPGVEGSPSFHPGQACPGMLGQFLHGIPCEPPRGHQVTALPPGGADTSVLGGPI